MKMKSKYKDLLCTCGEVLGEPVHQHGVHLVYICDDCGLECDDFINEDMFKD